VELHIAAERGESEMLQQLLDPGLYNMTLMKKVMSMIGKGLVKGEGRERESREQKN
jgi:hypothetical protein